MALQEHAVPFTNQTRLTCDAVLPLWGHRGPRPTPLAVHAQGVSLCEREAQTMTDDEHAPRREAYGVRPPKGPPAEPRAAPTTEHREITPAPRHGVRLLHPGHIPPSSRREEIMRASAIPRNNVSSPRLDQHPVRNTCRRLQHRLYGRNARGSGAVLIDIPPALPTLATYSLRLALGGRACRAR
jgi:hypothetical protein